MRSSARSTAAVSRPLLVALVLAAAAAAALIAPPPPRAMAADDDKDFKVLGEAKIVEPAKEGADASGGKRRGDKDKGGDKGGEKGARAGEISVSGAEGLVKRIKFEVRGAEVQFKKITVVYENGDPEEVEVRDEKVRNRGRTRTIDLKGGNRAIKKVLLSYLAEKTDNAKEGDRDARIILLGHK
jgi:hypothetical protein